MRPSQPIGKRLREYDVNISFDNKDAVQIILGTVKVIPFLEALEALWKREITSHQDSGRIQTPTAYHQV